MPGKAAAPLRAGRSALLLRCARLEINTKCFSLSLAAGFPPERRAKVTAGLRSGAALEEPLGSVRCGRSAEGVADLLLGMMDHFI